MTDRRRKIDLKDSKSKKKKEDVNSWTGLPYSQKYYDILDKRVKLPVYQFKDDLIAKVMEHQSVVVEGETGSGKTTQIPQFLLEAGLATQGKTCVACTQPRRVAATSIAQRVADEMDVELTTENLASVAGGEEKC